MASDHPERHFRRATAEMCAPGVFCQRATELAERDQEAQLMAMQIETEHICDEPLAHWKSPRA